MSTKIPRVAATAFLKSESLSGLLNAFSALTDIPLQVTPSVTTPGAQSRAPSDRCCAGLGLRGPRAQRACEQCRRAWAIKSAAERKSHVFSCPNGLAHLLVPLIREKEAIGCLGAGPVRVGAIASNGKVRPDGRGRLELTAAELKPFDSAVAAGTMVVLPRSWYQRRARKLGSDAPTYLAAIDSVPVLRSDKVEAALRMLQTLAESAVTLPPRAVVRSIRASGASGGPLMPSDIGRAALDQLRKLIPLRTASLQVIEEDDRSLLASIEYDNAISDPHLLRPVSDDPLLKRIVAARKPVVLSDTSRDRDWQKLTATWRVKSWIGAPVIFNHEVIGLLTLDHDKPGFYKEKHKKTVIAFAREIAPQVWNALLSVRTDRLSRDMKILDDVLQVIGAKLGTTELLQTIATQIAEKLHCSHCTVFLTEPAGHDVLLVPKVTHGGRPETLTRSFRRKEGLAGWVLDTGESIILSDAAHDPRFAAARAPRIASRSMLVAPIKVGDHTVGVISADQDVLGWFRRSDQRLVDALAQQAAIAIQRSRALNLLHDIGNRLTGAEDVNVVLQAVISGAIRLTNATTGVIYLISDDGCAVTKHLHPPGFPHPMPRMGDPHGLTRTAVRTGDVRVIKDTRKLANLRPLLRRSFKSMVVVPMKLGNKVVGVFYLHVKDAHDFTEMETTLLVTLATQAAIAIQKANLLTSLQRGLTAHRVFDNVLTNLAVQEPDQERTYDGIARGIQDMLGKEVSLSINMYDQNTRSFGECHSYGPLRQFLNAPPRPEVGTGAFVVEKGQSLYLEDVAAPPSGSPTVRHEAITRGVRSFAAIPLTRREQIVGVLFINSQVVLRFDDQTRSLLELFALQAGVAIEIARFHASAQFQSALVKAADLGFLAGGIAHEFRNRLQNMHVHIEAIEDRCTRRGDRRLLTKGLWVEIGRAQDAIATFQAFSHQKDETATLDLDVLVAQVVAMSRQRAKDHGIKLAHEGAGVGKIRTNATWVQSIVVNLLRNAIDAIEGPGARRRQVVVRLAPDPPRMVKIEVKDGGAGIPREVLGSLFLPFQTTRGDTGGFGLGLFWVNRLVQLMNGSIHVLPHNDWGGATFTVRLPRS